MHAEDGNKHHEIEIFDMSGHKLLLNENSKGADIVVEQKEINAM